MRLGALRYFFSVPALRGSTLALGYDNRQIPTLPLLIPGPPQIVSHCLDLCQVLLHLAPAIPQGIVRICVKSALKRSHSMFHVHHKEFLLKFGGRVVECKDIRERIRIVGRFLERPAPK
jgi:hypothetical protein